MSEPATRWDLVCFYVLLAMPILFTIWRVDKLEKARGDNTDE